MIKNTRSLSMWNICLIATKLLEPKFLLLLCLLPINDLLQQFEDYVKGIALQTRKTISLKICAKPGVN
jgi:hypothetical protein